MEIETLADILVKNGVKYAFGITGGGKTLSLIKELEARGVLYVNASHESSASIMAGAACKVLANSAISLSIKGPGLTNSIGGISYNFFENIPSISISEAYDFENNYERMHKRVNHHNFLDPLVSQIINLDINPKDLDLLLKKQIFEKKPLHLELSNRNSKKEIFINDKVDKNNELNNHELKSIISKSKKPIIILGSNYCNGNLIYQINSLKIPIFTTGSGRGLIDEDYQYSAGIFTGDGKELSLEFNIIPKADLIIALGLRSEEITGELKSKVPILLFDNDKYSRCSIENKSKLLRITTQSDNLIDLLKSLNNKEWGSIELKSGKEKLSKYLLKEKWLPAKCFAKINNIKYKYSLIIDTGNFCTIAEHTLLINKNRELIASNNGRFMGGSIPSAIGVTISKKNIPSFCILGDGGMQSYPAEFKLIKNLSLPICFLFMKDGYYSSVRRPGESDIALNAVKFANPSWLKFIHTLEIKAFKCKEIYNFEKIIDEWDLKSPIFIECCFEEKAYRNMTRKLR